MLLGSGELLNSGSGRAGLLLFRNRRSTWCRDGAAPGSEPCEEGSRLNRYIEFCNDRSRSLPLAWKSCGAFLTLLLSYCIVEGRQFSGCGHCDRGIQPRFHARGHMSLCQYVLAPFQDESFAPSQMGTQVHSCDICRRVGLISSNDLPVLSHLQSPFGRTCTWHDGPNSSNVSVDAEKNGSLSGRLSI